jgi:hypothetical protein
MAAYTLRIELLGSPSQQVYDELHARMKKGGFLQTITGTNPQGETKAYDLPHATYYGTSDATCAAVRDWPKSHATEAWGKSIVFVAQTSTWARS